MNCCLTHLLKSTCHKDDLYPTRVGHQAAVATSLIIRVADQAQNEGNINTAAMTITCPFLTFRLQFQHGSYFLFCKFLQLIKRTHAENSKTWVHSMWKKALQRGKIIITTPQQSPNESCCLIISSMANITTYPALIWSGSSYFQIDVTT